MWPKETFNKAIVMPKDGKVLVAHGLHFLLSGGKTGLA
jgi:hypothetical protein